MSFNPILDQSFAKEEHSEEAPSSRRVDMPPKKKEPKGGGDDDKPPPPPELPELTPHQLEMNERALVAEKLTHSLAAFRTRTASLERTNAALRTALGDTTRDANEVETYLTWELAARQEIVDELRTRVDAKTAEVDGETKGLDARVQSARAAAEAETATLTERVTTLRDTEPDITRRRDDKTRILDGLAEVSETVAKELHEMKANLHELESSLFRDRERLRRESAMRVKATRLSLMRLTDDQLETTTKRVIAQNERASSELADISRDANALIDKTDQLSAEHSTFGRELTLQRALVRNTEVREKDLRRCVDALAREVSRSDIAKASANEGVNSAQSAEDANRGFDFDDAVSTTAGLERETEALRSGLARHTAAMEGLARRARAFGAGGSGGIWTHLENDAREGSISLNSPALETVYGTLRRFVDELDGGEVALADLDASHRARALEVLHDELERAAVELYDEVAEANTQLAASTSTSTQPAGGSEGARGKRRYAPSPVAGAPKWT